MKTKLIRVACFFAALLALALIGWGHGDCAP